jgi:hypothetical protein
MTESSVVKDALASINLTSGFIAHHADARIDPSTHGIQARIRSEFIWPSEEDTLPPGFFLNRHLTLKAIDINGKPVQVTDPDPAVNTAALYHDLVGSDPSRYARFVRLPGTYRPGQKMTLAIEYEGTVYDSLHHPGERYARSFRITSGLIDERGVYLAGSTFWIPERPGSSYRFDLITHLPDGWRSLSQGDLVSRRPGFEHWRSTAPMDEIYLIAAPYVYAGENFGEIRVETYLYTEDQNLSEKYLNATKKYITLYSDLIGSYPYGKFALAENFWQTGFGMPSFTLLGRDVIHLPFIVHTSYGHEILHNWWGNGVFVDWDRGNWCEGITTYMADHYYKEQKGEGLDYRRNTLAGYTHFVDEGNDFPLREFRGRYSAHSQSIGYGKSLFIFHMLRKQYGDEIFYRSVRTAYRDFLFRSMSWDDWNTVFQGVTGDDLDFFFHQWVDLPGAPMLRIGAVEASPLPSGETQLTVQVIQENKRPYRLWIPIATWYGVEEPERRIEIDTMEHTGGTSIFRKRCASTPVRVQIDPAFDVFRQLWNDEVPPSIGMIMGARSNTVVLPSATGRAHREGYRKSCELFTHGDHVTVRDDSDTDTYDLRDRAGTKHATWITGFDNRFLGLVNDNLPPEYRVTKNEISTPDTVISIHGHTAVFTIRDPYDETSAWIFLGTDDPRALEGLNRKLPHYGKYGYLVFEGGRPDNILKGEWSAQSSITTREISSPDIHSTKRAISRDSLKHHVYTLASEEYGGRSLLDGTAEKAAAYICERFREIGLHPGGDHQGFYQRWNAPIGPEGESLSLANVIGVLPGNDPRLREEYVIIGAHYDHLGRGWPDVKSGNEGKIHYGADDNASGIAVLIELARTLSRRKICDRTLAFIAFSAEENGAVGSTYFTLHPTIPLSNVNAMINIDSVGRLRDGRLFLFGTGTAAELPGILEKCSALSSSLSIEMIADPLTPSDQTPFVNRKIPCIQYNTGAHLDYHTPGDTREKVNMQGLEIISGHICNCLIHLGTMPVSLSPSISDEMRMAGQAGMGGEYRHIDTGNVRNDVHMTGTSSHRRTSLGTIPDFTTGKDGYRIEGVRPGSPAEQSGLKKGDVITGVSGKAIHDLKTFGEILRAFAPGDTISITYLRDGQNHHTSAVLEER